MHHTTTWPDSMFDNMRQTQDPLADRVIDDLITQEGPHAARTAFDTLITNLDLPVDDMPPSVQAFLSESGTLPSWADTDKIQRAEKVFLDYGPYFMLFLYFKSLPILYSCGNGAQVLLNTGRLMEDRSEYDRFARRIAETAFFLMEVMSQDGLGPQRRGLRAIRRVRLIHAAVRKFIPADRWDDAWGKPLNQEDMAATLMTFSITMVDAMEQLKQPMSQEDAEAYYHHWCVIGYFLGVAPDMIPRDMADGRILLKRILNRQMSPSYAGHQLTKALIEFGKKTAPPLTKNLPVILIRYLAGKKIAKTLGVKNTFGFLRWIVPPVFRRSIGLIEEIEDLGKPLDWLFEKIAMKTMHRFIAVFDTYKGEKFVMPEAMRKRWQGEESE